MNITKDMLISTLVKATNNSSLQGVQTSVPLKDQGVDSLDVISFFFQLEEETKTKISVEEQNKLRTIEDIMEFFNKKT